VRARAYLAHMRRGEQPHHDTAETATLALSEPTHWGRYIVVRVSDWPEQVHEFHPHSRVHWRNAGEWTPALKEIAEQFRWRGYRVVYAESAR
jgi:hypothetical protein